MSGTVVEHIKYDGCAFTIWTDAEGAFHISDGRTISPRRKDETRPLTSLEDAREEAQALARSTPHEGLGTKTAGTGPLLWKPTVSDH